MSWMIFLRSDVPWQATPQDGRLAGCNFRWHRWLIGIHHRFDDSRSFTSQGLIENVAAFRPFPDGVFLSAAGPREGRKIDGLRTAVTKSPISIVNRRSPTKATHSRLG